MQVKFNPKDSNVFASCSLDNSIKVWGLNTSSPYYSLNEHKLGVNCIDYSTASDKPYLVSGSDDKVSHLLQARLLARQSVFGTIRQRHAFRLWMATQRMSLVFCFTPSCLSLSLVVKMELFVFGTVLHISVR